MVKMMMEFCNIFLFVRVCFIVLIDLFNDVIMVVYFCFFLFLMKLNFLIKRMNFKLIGLVVNVVKLKLIIIDGDLL